MGNEGSFLPPGLKVWKAQIERADKDASRNRFSVLLSRTNHLSYHLGQAVLGLK
jgi:hypothetical protein